MISPHRIAMVARGGRVHLERHYPMERLDTRTWRPDNPWPGCCAWVLRDERYTYSDVADRALLVLWLPLPDDVRPEVGAIKYKHPFRLNEIPADCDPPVHMPRWRLAALGSVFRIEHGWLIQHFGDLMWKDLPYDLEEGVYDVRHCNWLESPLQPKENSMSFTFPSLADTGRTIHGHNAIDEDGNPAGGFAADGVLNIADGQIPGLFVRWQDGPMDRSDPTAKPNGAFLEDYIEVGIRRLEHYQESKFACEANAKALIHLRSAKEQLLSRRGDRRDRGVEGKHQV